MPRTSLALLVLALATLTACATSAGAAGPRRSANELTAEDLKDPSVATLTAWDAITRLKPNWLRPRGASSLNTPDDNMPRAMLNESVQPLDILRSLRAAEISTITYLSASDATTKYGTGYTNGLIMISTVQRPD